MKILLVSPDNSQIPSFGYRIKNALVNLGHNVDTFNYRKNQLHRFNATKKLLNKLLLDKAEKLNPDLMLVSKGESLIPGIVQKISNLGIKTANWSMDDPFGKFSSFNKLPNINEYNYFFVFDPYYVNKIKDYAEVKTYYLPCAVDPALFTQQIPLSERKYKYDLTFVGSHQSNREKFFQKLHHKVNVFGYRWKTSNNLFASNRVFDANKNLTDLKTVCRIFNQSKINLNKHYPHSIESVNLRTFEIPSTKSFQLCDYFTELPHLFNIRKEIAVYKSADDLNELIPYYLDHEEERNKISENGLNRVLEEHTFEHRMKFLISKVF